MMFAEGREHLSSSFCDIIIRALIMGNLPLCEVCKVYEASFSTLVELSQTLTRFVPVIMRLRICDNWDSFVTRSPVLMVRMHSVCDKKTTENIDTNDISSCMIQLQYYFPLWFMYL